MFVYGGIAGKGEDEQSKHYPSMANPLCEVYDPKKNAWSEVIIDGGIPLGCFGYCPLTNLGNRLILVGGTDGSLLQDYTIVLDFEKKSAKIIDSNLGMQVAMNKVVLREEDKTLFTFGGYSSGGLIYKTQLKIEGDDVKLAE